MNRSSYLLLLRLVMVFVLLTLLSHLRGRLSPHEVPDTASYLNYSFASADEVARSIRSPGYPAILRVGERIFPTSAAALQSVVVFQILIHAVAVCLWFDELMGWSVSRRAAMIGCLALAVTNTFWDHGNTIATDAISMSMGLIIAAMVVRVWRLGNEWVRSATIGVLVLLTIAIRPAYLFLLPWGFLAMLVRPAGSVAVDWPQRFRDGATIVMIPVFALATWCGFRGWAVGDFGLLPFGHQNMAAVTTQLLDNEELARLPGVSGELGSAIGEARLERFEMEFRSQSYMALEGRWDDMTYEIVIPAAAEVVGGDGIRQHQSLAQLDATIVTTYPFRFGKWLGLAIRRGVWGSFANLAMHPVYFPCLMGLAVGAVVWAIGPVVEKACWDGSAIKPIVMVTITFAISKIAFVALTSPPIGRFSDAAMAMVPMLVAVVVVSVSDRPKTVIEKTVIEKTAIDRE